MADWYRRSVVATGGTLATGALLASVGASGAEDGPTLEEPDGWSSHGGTAGNTRYVSADGLDEPETIAWQYDRGGLVAVVDGTVYLQTGGNVHALDADDGSPLWERNGVRAAGTPAVTDDAVYVSGAQLTALEASSGDVRWTAEFGTGASTSEPVAAFGAVYVTVDGTLLAFDAVDGSLRWQRETVDVTYHPPEQDEPEEYAYAFNTGTGATAAADGTLWALLDERRNEGLAGTDAVVALDPTTGETQWSDHLDPGYSADGLTATDDVLFIENPEDEGVIVFEIESREGTDIIPDSFTTATVGEMVVTQGRYGLTATGSDSSWETDDPYAFGALTIAGDTVVVANSDGNRSAVDELVGLDLEDGSDRWRFEFDEKQWAHGSAVTCVVSGETVYVGRNEGLTAVRPAGSNASNGDDETGNDETAGNETDEYSGEDVTDETGGADGEPSEDEPERSDGETRADTASDDASFGTEASDDASGAAATAERQDDRDEEDESDGMPGFTGGAGIVGGALGLEWVRRRVAGPSNEEDA